MVEIFRLNSFCLGFLKALEFAEESLLFPKEEKKRDTPYKEDSFKTNYTYNYGSFCHYIRFK